MDIEKQSVAGATKRAPDIVSPMSRRRELRGSRTARTPHYVQLAPDGKLNKEAAEESIGSELNCKIEVNRPDWLSGEGYLVYKRVAGGFLHIGILTLVTTQDEYDSYEKYEE